MTSQDLVRDGALQAHSIIAAALEKAQAAGALTAGGEPPAFVVEIPADPTHGDFASNVALAGAKAFRAPPRKIAEAVLEHMDLTGSWFERGEIAGPGFLNLFLKPDWFAAVLETVGELGESYGRTDTGKGQKVMVEFVSANPTGPMHMGNARGGAVGDCLAAALDAAGYDVYREFLINDAGNQIEKFAISLEARYLQIYKGEDEIPFPEDGYQGEDIRDRAQEFAHREGDAYLDCPSEERRKALVDYALPRNIQAMKDDLATYRISYDRWFAESELHQRDLVKQVVGTLTQRGLTYEKDGALWYKASEFGGEKDEVLIRGNGNATYFAADIAYHYDKFALRGFDKVIDVWGADHHGHVSRLKGAMDAVGLSGDKLDILLMQLVRLMKDGEPYRMSKRSGRSVTLRDLLDEVPIDAARFFFNMQSPGSTMDFDLDLAVEQSSTNPVYYVQYAHARICSIIKKLEESGAKAREVTQEELLRLNTPEEIALIRRLGQLPGEIVSVVERYDPSALTHYATDVATLFHKFYNTCRVQTEDEPLMQARWYLCLCVRSVLKNTLKLLGITAPESM